MWGCVTASGREGLRVQMTKLYCGLSTLEDVGVLLGLKQSFTCPALSEQIGSVRPKFVLFCLHLCLST